MNQTAKMDESRGDREIDNRMGEAKKGSDNGQER